MTHTIARIGLALAFGALTAGGVVLATPAGAETPAYGSMSYAGTCAEFQGIGVPDYFVCVPEVAPDGNVVSDIYGDGTGGYEGPLQFDPETLSFRESYNH